MIQKKRLTAFYVEQYTKASKKRPRKMPGTNEMLYKTEKLFRLLENTKSSRVNIRSLEEYHRQLKNVVMFARRKNRDDILEKLNTVILPRLAELDLGLLLDEQKKGMTEDFLVWLRKERPCAVCQETLFTLYPAFRQHVVKDQIMDLVPVRPEMEFPEVREIHRHFILHIGPTNSGKTFRSLERLKLAGNGVYLGPLRLLALEVFEQMQKYHVPCTMRTGQECIEEAGSRVTACTIEMADYDENYDIAVIDEAQMIADRDRGHSWTRAILGVKADEIHICMSPAAEEVVTHLIALCEDTCEVRHYERKTALVCEQEAFVFPDDVTEGDALITFTKRAVLDIAGRLEREGIRASVIYGSLPPEIRRRQIRLFLSHETKVVVSTDAIGMGLNLPVRRIVFIQTEKYDGISTRPLNIPEIRQIAGRAGRFGMYDTGYVNAMGEDARNYIAKRFDQPEPVIKKVSLGFPHVLLDMDEPLNAILKIWKSVEPSAPFEKISIDEILFLYDKAYKARKEIDGFEDKHTLYRMLTCSIDIKNRDIVDLWLYYCKTYTADVSLHFPSLIMCNDKGLMRYETFYKMLDLYHQFSTRMGKISDSERLNREREKTEDTIMKLLAKDKKDYIRTCKYCGVTLPVGYPFRVCEKCYGHSPYKKI